MPANTFVGDMFVEVTEAFDDTPVLIVGDGSNDNGYFEDGEISEATLTVSHMLAPDVAAAYAVKGARPIYTAADTIDVLFTHAGSNTVGEANLWVMICSRPS